MRATRRAVAHVVLRCRRRVVRVYTSPSSVRMITSWQRLYPAGTTDLGWALISQPTRFPAEHEMADPRSLHSQPDGWVPRSVKLRMIRRARAQVRPSSGLPMRYFVTLNTLGLRFATETVIVPQAVPELADPAATAPRCDHRGLLAAVAAGFQSRTVVAIDANSSDGRPKESK